MMVRFATLCDRCQKRAEEYTAWPSCRECSLDICYACDMSGHRHNADVDKPETTLCRACAENESEED